MAAGKPPPQADPARPATGGGPTAAATSTAKSGDTAAAEVEWADRMLGEFRILRRLGHGGMAEVFLAEQTSLKRNVAVKVLRQERVSDISYLKRFKTEAMAAAALSHPNIVQVFVIGEHAGVHFIAQEYVQGLNLREFLAKKGPPDQATALRIIRQVASALQAAHAAGIVHRDIKPENILLTRKGEAKVGDFGLAQLTQQGERVNLTQVGVTMGTPLYMSPEQVHGKKLDARSDIYSLGVTCYHLLTGTPPFRGETAMSVAVQHLKEEPESLEKIRGDVSPVLCRIVRKMMAKDPEKRQQSAQEVLKELKRVGPPGTSGDPPGPDVEEPLFETAPEGNGQGGLRRLALGLWHVADWPRAQQIWVLALSVLLVAIAGAGIGWLVREPDPFAAPVPTAKVPQKDSISSQHYYAIYHPKDLDAWQAVIDYPAPAADSEIHKNRARQHLAMLFLISKRDFDQAQGIFDYFVSEPSSEWRAFGLAGQAVVWHERGNYAQSLHAIEQLKPLWSKGKLEDRKMEQLVADVAAHNLQMLKQETDEGLKKLIEHARQPAEDDVNQNKVD